MTIALICPTYRRPEQCRKMVDSARATASDKNNIEIYLGYVQDEEQYVKDAHIAVFPDFPTSHKWNTMAEWAAKNPNNTHFMLAADDIIFSTPLWDKAILDSYEKGKPHVYHLQDSRDPDGTPHPIINREYMDILGFFLPPIYCHWFVDSWTVEIAKSNNCFTHLKDYGLIHDKKWDKGIKDEGHDRIHKMGWLNRDMWVNEHCQDILNMYKAKLDLALRLGKAA